MKVLVIIVTYNAIKWIDKCISSVQKSDIALDVMVIDNVSSDGTIEYIRNRYPKVMLVCSEKNLGFGKGNNIGLKYAIEHDYDYVYLLNQDAWIFPDTIKKMILAHKSHSCYGVLSPIQLQANGRYFDSNFAGVTCKYSSNIHLISDLYFQNPKEIYEVSSVMAAHWLISKECLKKVGGFSPSFTQYGEDDNYIERASYHGYKIGIVTNATAVHDRGDRINTREQDIYRVYVTNILVLSQINNPHKHPIWYIFANAIRYSIKFQSGKPMTYFFKTLFNIRYYQKNRKLSYNECAFIRKIDCENPISFGEKR